jgi:hypothetical protein
MKNFYLTKSGNILVANDGTNFFMNSKGEFLRVVSSGEFNFLTEKAALPEFDFKGGFSIPEVALWKKLWSVDYEDCSQSEAGRCSDGGNYSYLSTDHFFVRNRNGVLEFCRLEYCKTSSCFHYTDDGDFQESSSNLIVQGIDDVEQWRYDTAKYGPRAVDIVLDKLARKSDLQEAIFATGSENSPQHNDNGKRIKFELDEETKILRLKKIHELTGILPTMPKES